MCRIYCHIVSKFVSVPVNEHRLTWQVNLEVKPNAGVPHSTRSYPEVGPITRHEQAAAYLREHRIPQMFESIVAGLMIERPDDPFNYMDKRLDRSRKKVFILSTGKPLFIIYIQAEILFT